MKNDQPKLATRFADPKNDEAFKKIFVDHQDLTKSFLNVTLHLTEEKKDRKSRKLPC